MPYKKSVQNVVQTKLSKKGKEEIYKDIYVKNATFLFKANEEILD